MFKCDICGLEKPWVTTSLTTKRSYCESCVERYIMSGDLTEPVAMAYAPKEQQPTKAVKDA